MSDSARLLEWALAVAAESAELEPLYRRGEDKALIALAAELQRLREALACAAYVSRHLLEAADDSVFEGVIGPEGQRESDYRISMLAAEIREWAALAGPQG